MTQLDLTSWSAPQADRARLKGQNLAIYERLQRGPATNAELAAISLKYTSRIDDVRKAGIAIDAKRVGTSGTWVYSLAVAQ